MSTSITTALVNQFGSNFHHLSQQKGSRLRSAVRVESQKGTQAFYDIIGSVDAQARSGRHSATPQLDTPHTRRAVSMTDYEWADLIDSQDKIRMLGDPTSEYVLAAAHAFGRKMDDVIIAAALGTAATGVAGAGTQALGNTRKVASVAAAANSNLNVLALRKAKYLLDSSDVDPSTPRYIAINASALEALLADTQVTSSDYNSVKALVQGEVDTFMGFKFIITNRLITTPTVFKFNTGTGLYDAGGTDSSGSTKSMIAWAQDGLLLSVGEDYTTKMSERDDKGYAMQVYARMSIGSVRMEEAKVVEIVCAQ